MTSDISHQRLTFILKAAAWLYRNQQGDGKLSEYIEDRWYEGIAPANVFPCVSLLITDGDVIRFMQPGGSGQGIGQWKTFTLQVRLQTDKQRGSGLITLLVDRLIACLDRKGVNTSSLQVEQLPKESQFFMAFLYKGVNAEITDLSLDYTVSFDVQFSS